MQFRLRVVLFSFFAFLFATSAFADAAGNWPRWRGPRDNGSTESGSYPVKWAVKSGILWKAPLPGKGCSTPVVWDRRIYLTAPVEGKDAVLALDWSGKLLWQTPIGDERKGKHRNGSGSNPSPVVDGRDVFVYFKSGTLACVDIAGKLRWKTNLQERFGKDTLYWDIGTSPVLTEKDVVVAVMHGGDSYLIALEKNSGKLHWKVDRNYPTAVEGDHSYATPQVIQHRGKEAIVVWGAEHLTAHDAADGRILWSCGDFNPQAKKNWPAIASPVIAGEIAVVPYARGNCLYGIKLGGSGDVTATHRVWKRDDTGSMVTTPAEFKGRVYVLRDRGEIECVDPATGKTIGKGQLPKRSASYYASPVVADGKLYAAREDGVVFVVRSEPPFEILAENNLGEQLIASPVPVEGRLLIRGEKHLFCIGSSGARPIRVVLIGDSTVCNYPKDDPCRGWGQFLQGYFNDHVQVINLAKSGASTKTFIQGKYWQRALAEKPDFVLIQFGHNDSHGPSRRESTDAATDYKEYLRRYIDESRAAAAVPILVTPVCRRTFERNGTLRDNLRPYADAMKEIGKEKGVKLIDLHATSGKQFLALGEARSEQLANKTGDRTHFNEKGARAMTALVIKDLVAVEPTLAREAKPTSPVGDEAATSNAVQK